MRCVSEVVRPVSVLVGTGPSGREGLCGAGDWLDASRISSAACTRAFVLQAKLMLYVSKVCSISLSLPIGTSCYVGM